MRRLPILILAGLTSFALGITIFFVFRSSVPPKPKVVQVIKPTPVETVRQQPVLVLDESSDETATLPIVINNHGSNPATPSFSHRSVTLDKQGRSIVDIDLGENTDDREVILNFLANAEYRV